MLRRLLGLGSFVATALWIYFWEWIRSQIYERVQHMLAPYLDWVTADHLAKFGSPAIFICIGLWLFWKTRPKAPSEVHSVSPIPVGDIASSSVQARQSLCDFMKFEWSYERLDPGENFGGAQGFYKIWIPVKFHRNAKSVTVRVSALRPVQAMDRRPPLFTWKAIEDKNVLERDILNIVIATVAENRQHHGYYGDSLAENAFYISGISRHLFKVEVFCGDTVESVKLYLESPSKMHSANPADGPGKLAGIIVLQENKSVFQDDWIAESRSALSGARAPYVSKPAGMGAMPFGSGPPGS